MDTPVLQVPSEGEESSSVPNATTPTFTVIENVDASSVTATEDSELIHLKPESEEAPTKLGEESSPCESESENSTSVPLIKIENVDSATTPTEGMEAASELSEMNSFSITLIKVEDVDSTTTTPATESSVVAAESSAAESSAAESSAAVAAELAVTESPTATSAAAEGSDGLAADDSATAASATAASATAASATSADDSATAADDSVRLRTLSTSDMDTLKDSPLEGDSEVPLSFKALSINPEVSEWREITDPKTGKCYYYNSRTKQTSWVLPEKSDSSPDPSSPKSSEQVWRKVTNLKNGKPYYYNVLTRQTSWTQPAGFEEGHVLASPTNRTDSKVQEEQDSSGDDYIERIRQALLLRSPVNAKTPRLSSPAPTPVTVTSF